MRPSYSNPLSKEKFLGLPDGTLCRKGTFGYFVVNDESRSQVNTLFPDNGYEMFVESSVVLLESAEKVASQKTLYKASEIPPNGAYYIVLLTQDGGFEKQVGIHNCQSRVFAPYGFKAIFCNPMGGPHYPTKYVPQLEL